MTTVAFTAIGLVAKVPNPLAVGAVIRRVVAIQPHARFVDQVHPPRLHETTSRDYAGRFVPAAGRSVAPTQP